MAQDRAKVGPRWPSWSQDGPTERQGPAKMAKLEPRWSQHGPKMAQDELTWANMASCSESLRLCSKSGGGQVCIANRLDGRWGGYLYIGSRDKCLVSTADIFPVSTAHISITIHHSASAFSDNNQHIMGLRQQPTSGYSEGLDIERPCEPMVAMIQSGYGFGYSQSRLT